MKNVSQKSWFSVSIESNNNSNLDFIYSQFYNYMVGSTENNHEFIFYFEEDNKKIINDILDTQFIDYKFKIEDIQYQNWHTSYEKYFKPIKLNETLMIVPDWYKINNNDNLDYIRIVPGMAFGTGHHETTQLIIKSLLKEINLNDRVLDLGAGSGILSIAALKFGASNVMAIEYDEDCKNNFYENMALNNINENYNFLIQDVLAYQDYNYDLIVANINKNIILELLPYIKKFRKNKSKIILSGLLTKDRIDVINLINKLNFSILEENQKGEWICIVID